MATRSEIDGHVWVGHYDDVMSEIGAFLNQRSSAGPTYTEALRPRGDGTFGSVPPVLTAQSWR